MDKWTGIGLGATSVVSSIASVAAGYPTGVLGQAYWQNQAMMTSALGLFGVLTTTVLGGVILAYVGRSRDRQLAQYLEEEEEGHHRRRRSSMTSSSSFTNWYNDYRRRNRLSHRRSYR